ncbi:SpoIIE family protein phosphatase [Nocardioides sp. BP30]|uniref:PP2C family protein-serine/threonine phosphatase n=1 Tax=Nocardioides sp. BP30 TaxID=3036374 RepID=UPI0024693F40|nr:SpoIIE family protein phosphatase [Nocardioides sp. BP30]WGL50833.1 SpoIIE family protein phosphatase [Nocardioides sp. BP30]
MPGPELLAAVRLKQELLVEDVQTDPRLADPEVRFFTGVRLDLGDAAEAGVLWAASARAGTADPAVPRALADLGAMLARELTTSASLELGREIQNELLPLRPPQVSGYTLAAHSLPSLELGGDFYDWWRVGGSLRIVLVDVMGKGVASSLIAAGVRAMMHAALTHHGPEAAIARVAGDLETDFDRTARFATCFIGALDEATGVLRYVDAGHGIAVLLHADGSYEQLAAGDLPLGALPGLTWQEQTATLGPGDVLLVGSDGVLERYDRLSDVLEEVRRLYREGVDLDTLVQTIGGDRSVDDDVTIVAVRRM